MRKRTRARECALQVLYQIDVTSDLPQDSLEAYWAENDEPQEIREFASKIVCGTQEKKDDIDKIISKYAENWTLQRMAVVDRNILRLAAYELLYCPDTPPKVCINEAVELAKKFADPDSGKFVNGILDGIHKETKKDAK
ncbi:MAG: transcription antitermination factor NusB [Candidatus Omnitrophica bacterium CG12_big_fil_rev_8_21_14_0_65_43_15]|uniref:Transcription antitermination protein NusB n=1 Tax=Candidatus Taenaricola geysiri TaxID=1974752 RepID=A0A2J0LFN2_9BACT|nr:MAG: transcription antitermination factor NusB [Candidatus Omnitrophica bacterium CG1_02_43_210]PIR65946.1 MAG: transcription antitermination factor NusB [Candidatus Omnitrophica bacterium CG10_big_fil_rev_8_21_14_0_10_43_8]PIV11743.1 MAG: transcription antitermination factor NusB [Candidatus Omnitrophica bacterium CG03_land_8_20_14_0_80_43_22]PIW66658.1 MAG: transcription antitermination factor NusB [Candidatus Omnitrophica bacterium CG12_big_fil_rev_8_21_14_0_65_43_15]PIW80356.1 MAG: trans